MHSLYMYTYIPACATIGDGNPDLLNSNLESYISCGKEDKGTHTSVMSGSRSANTLMQLHNAS